MSTLVNAHQTSVKVHNTATAQKLKFSQLIELNNAPARAPKIKCHHRPITRKKPSAMYFGGKWSDEMPPLPSAVGTELAGWPGLAWQTGPRGGCGGEGEGRGAGRGGLLRLPRISPKPGFRIDEPGLKYCSKDVLIRAYGRIRLKRCRYFAGII